MKSKIKNMTRADLYKEFDFRSAGRVLRRSHSVHAVKRESRNQQNTDSTNNNITTNNKNNNSTMKMKEQRDYDNIHIALVGAKSCGKSALAVRYLTKRFIGEYDSHKDVTLQRSMTVADRQVRVALKDTTSTGWLKSPTALINWTTAIVVVYSITDRTSFALAKNILELVHKTKPLSSRCTLLIGNKCDLMHVRQVEQREARNLAEDFGVQFLECSAAENYEDISSCFTRLLVEAMIVQSSKKHSWDNQNGDEVRQQENKIRKRSISLSQNPSRDNNNNNNNTMSMKEKKDSIIKMGDERIPSPSEFREPPAPQRKQSLRRKISGIGSKLVGSGQNNR